MKYQDIDEAFARTRPSLGTLRRILRFVKPYWRQVIAPFVIEAFSVLSMAITPFLLKIAIDEFIVPALGDTEGAGGAPVKLGYEHALTGLFCVAGLMVLAMALNCVLQMVQRLLIQRAGQQALNDLRRWLFGHIQRLSMDFFDREKQGRIIARLDRDIENLEPLITFVPLFFVHSACSFLVVTGVLLWKDWRLCGLIVAFSPLVLLAGFASEKWGLPIYRRIRKTVSRMTSHVTENVTGVQVVQAFGREDLNLDRYEHLLDEYKTHQVAAAHVRGITFPSMIMVFGIARAGVLVYGAHALSAGHISLGMIPAAMMYIGMIYGPIMMIAHLYDHLLSSSASSERVVQLMDREPTIVDRPAAKQMPLIEGHVRFEHVSFQYEDDPESPWILEDIDFDAPAGSIIALVGPTGAGKTSIVNLIPRFYEPQQGRVLIDGTDIRDVTQLSLHEQMGIVLQENFLFTGTVMDNLIYGRPDTTEEEAIEAAKALASYDTISRLADGFQTDVRERGGAISHGERQLICFTRAMIANPRILILDEATSAVDTNTEIIIQNALWKLMEGRTTFVVAHRLSTVRHADTILVIDGGRIVEAGNHDSLIDRDGVYAEMFEEFIRGPEEL
ncbi:MAG: ABC transporter ATP-binding protein [Planctomycetota bacterium]